MWFREIAHTHLLCCTPVRKAWISPWRQHTLHFHRVFTAIVVLTTLLVTVCGGWFEPLRGHTIVCGLMAEPDFDTFCVTILCVSAG